VPLALQRTIAVVDRARTEPVDPATLDRAKAKVLAEEFLSKQSNTERAADAALLELFGLPPDEPRRFMQQVQSLTAEQLQAAARAYLRNPVVVVLTHQPLPQAELDQAIMLPAADPDPSASAAAPSDARD
jgi:zinc protease